jgi:ParB-like chromosome segregation protein Spo0J
MLVRQAFEIARIRVPSKRQRDLDPARVQALAEDILENGQKVPIRVRPDGEGFVLVEDLHRLEAMRALGETAITGYRTSAALR